MTREDEELDRHCREALDLLQREYDQRARPYLDQLVEIASRQPPKSIIIVVDWSHMEGLIKPAS